MIPYHLDNGKIPSVNLNRQLRKSKRAMCRNRPDAPTTLNEARQIYNITQNLNSLPEVQLAITRRADHDRTRKGLI